MSTSGAVSRPQPDRVLGAFVECGSLNTFEKKNSEKVLVVAEPVVTVELRPALVLLELVVEAMSGGIVPAGERDAGPDEEQAGHPLGMVRARMSERCAPSESDTTIARSVSGRIETASASAAYSASAYASTSAAGPSGRCHVGSKVTTRKCRAKYGNLHLPDARVDDRPRRDEEDRRLARLRRRSVRADAVALDVAVGRRGSGARLLAGRTASSVLLDSSQASIQSSSARAPSRFPTGRSRMIPR
jgi:hypothetical protein